MAKQVAWFIGIGALTVVTGCATKKPSYLPTPAKVEAAREAERERSHKAAKEPEAPTSVVALVAYDVEGKPAYVQLQQSTGDPARDQRAMQMIFDKRFPPGKPDTVLVTVDVRSIPPQ